MANLAAHSVILDVSSEVPGCPSINVLDSDPSKIWLTETGLPQWMSLSLLGMGDENRKNKELVIKTIGWQCWHPYSTNPKSVSLHVSRDGSRFRLWDTFDGPQKRGVHLFQCSPIAIAIYPYISIEISETHGGDSTYMNRLFLYEDEIVGSSPSHGTVIPKLAPLGTPAPPHPPLNFADEADDLSPTSDRSSGNNTEENDPVTLTIVHRLESALGIRGQSPDSILFDDRSYDDDEEDKEEEDDDEEEEEEEEEEMQASLLGLESRLANLERAVLLTAVNPAPAPVPAPALVPVGVSVAPAGEDLVHGPQAKPPPGPPPGQHSHPYKGAQVAVRRKSAALPALAPVLTPTPVPVPAVQQEMQREGETGGGGDRGRDRDNGDTDRRVRDLERLNQHLLTAVSTLSEKLASSSSASSGSKGAVAQVPDREEEEEEEEEEEGEEEEEDEDEDEDEEKGEDEEEEKEEGDVKHVVEQAVSKAVAGFISQSAELLRRLESQQSVFVGGLASLAAESVTECLESGPEAAPAPPPLDLVALRKSCGLGPDLQDASREKRDTNSAFDSTFASRRREHGGGSGGARRSRRRRRRRTASSSPSALSRHSESPGVDQVTLLAKALKAAHIKKKILEEQLRKLNQYSSLSMCEKEIRYFGEPTQTQNLHWRY